MKGLNLKKKCHKTKIIFTIWTLNKKIQIIWGGVNDTTVSDIFKSVSFLDDLYFSLFLFANIKLVNKERKLVDKHLIAHYMHSKLKGNWGSSVPLFFLLLLLILLLLLLLSQSALRHWRDVRSSHRRSEDPRSPQQQRAWYRQMRSRGRCVSLGGANVRQWWRMHAHAARLQTQHRPTGREADRETSGEASGEASGETGFHTDETRGGEGGGFGDHGRGDDGA